MNLSKPIIYTVGHSTHTLEYFGELLTEYRVNCIVDVRSVPASGYNPQYNQESIKGFLKESGIAYLHFPEEFGARHTDRRLLDNNGKVDFEKVRESWAFKNGLERLWSGVDKGLVIAIMCSESEPFDCHRFSMVSKALVSEGFEVKHIMKNKTLKSNEELENQLLKKYQSKLPIPDMFNPSISETDQLNEAYKLRNKDIGYSTHTNKGDDEIYD